MEKEEYKETIIVDKELISDIKEGDKEFEEGKTVTLKSIKEIEDHFTAIANKENEG
jgi:flagellar assembly factor FliW